MKFYSNVTTGGRQVIFLWMDAEDASHLGPIGTRLALTNRGDGVFILKPDAKSRARLHASVRNKSQYEVVLQDKEKIWPISGKTAIPCIPIPDGLALEPALAKPTPIQSSKGTSGPRQHQKLPLNLPPKEKVEPPRKSQKSWTKADLRSALLLVNEVVSDIQKTGVEVQLKIVWGKLHATIIEEILPT